MLNNSQFKETAATQFRTYFHLDHNNETDIISQITAITAEESSYAEWAKTQALSILRASTTEELITLCIDGAVEAQSRQSSLGRMVRPSKFAKALDEILVSILSNNDVTFDSLQNLLTEKNSALTSLSTTISRLKTQARDDREAAESHGEYRIFEKDKDINQQITQREQEIAKKMQEIEKLKKVIATNLANNHITSNGTYLSDANSSTLYERASSTKRVHFAAPGATQQSN